MQVRDKLSYAQTRLGHAHLSLSLSSQSPTPVLRHCVTSPTSREHSKKPQSLSIAGPLVFSVCQFVDPRPRSSPESIGLRKYEVTLEGWKESHREQIKSEG
ncbi:hypothetical protein GALMADRAFT_257606 [Galerina marginata CBS 339.88]|uniref:Uncharacterized protein n=1 Tax=Galerina marginata (strain CBS 339.88) TaxID=685588 RepID=A0A067SAZ3_GALM3|nr:hypothetical protein GALMADRAFT_257606 [Galerina marginata CBS 339.88]